MGTHNPLDSAGLTIETVKSGDQITVYVPNEISSTRSYKVLTEPYIDDDGDMVVEVESKDGRELTMLTSEAGLSGGRYDGIWTHVAIINK